jgi:uncharacterized protein YcbK (DUF882 family)
MTKRITSEYFTDSELERCSPSCSLQDMHQATIDRLDAARKAADTPFIINSAYRSSAWDKSKGRSGTGAHTLGRAVDIRCGSDAARWKIVNALLAAGFTRIGIAKTYIHADDSEVHSQCVMWVY